MCVSCLRQFKQKKNRCCCCCYIRFVKNSPSPNNNNNNKKKENEKESLAKLRQFLLKTKFYIEVRRDVKRARQRELENNLNTKNNSFIFFCKYILANFFIFVIVFGGEFRLKLEENDKQEEEKKICKLKREEF